MNGSTQNNAQQAWQLEINPRAKNSPKALYSMVLGPKYFKYESLEPWGFDCEQSFAAKGSKIVAS